MFSEWARVYWGIVFIVFALINFITRDDMGTWQEYLSYGLVVAGAWLLANAWEKR